METELPLMSWKGSGSWISGVRFVEENPMLLLSSSNDGGIVVWDLKRLQASPSTSSRSPPVVTKLTAGLHSAGIFAMDRFGCSIATALKDSSVGLSRLTPAGIWWRNGTFPGTIPGEANTLADCGADGRICVLDTRSPHPCTLTVETQHMTGINTVEWCKLDESLLLSASKDPTLHLFDVRNPSRPLHVLQGHVESSTGTCRQICRPCFVDGGKAVATPGQGSRKISLFDVGKGAMISQGIIGYDANLVTFTNHAEQQILWAAGRYINQLCPLLHRC
uniref:Uncharacterized protein n=1 Tax=Ananas comosus var. bracteatus TaxID=296719 RepID=A0A6V7PZK7_ANACO|nr:unnamed protein product [Ananas comosus var. bracteatus]